MSGPRLESLVLSVQAPDCGFEGIHRVLQVNDYEDEAVLIPIPDVERFQRYAKGFWRHPASRLGYLLETKRLLVISLDIPPAWLLSDKEITRKFPPGKSGISHPIRVRNENLALVREVLAPVPDFHS
jgi:hypothetical protein